MSRTNLFAYTTPGCNYPSYVSINLVSEDQEVEITVRSGPKPDGSCGETAAMTFSLKEFRRLAHDAFLFACTTSA